MLECSFAEATKRSDVVVSWLCQRFRAICASLSSAYRDTGVSSPPSEEIVDSIKKGSRVSPSDPSSTFC